MMCLRDGASADSIPTWRPRPLMSPLKTHIGVMSVDVMGKGSEKDLPRPLPVPKLDDTIWTEVFQHRSPIVPTTHADPAPVAL